MRRTAANVPTGALLESDVVVVGAGPLGIVTALELADKGSRVLLVESGSDGYVDAVQELSDNEEAGGDRWHVEKRLTVRRQVGGTTSVWSGRCVAFDPIDLEERLAITDVRWPVSYAEICSYLQRACDWCGCGEAKFNALQVTDLADRELVPGLTDGAVRTTNLERWSPPIDFGKEYGTRLARHPRVDLVSGLTCVNISCDSGGQAVDHLQLRTLDGKYVKAAAPHYVLATGGLEATRLLMASRDIHPNGIGNHAGHLGRWYMTHVEARVARIHLSTPPKTTIYDYERGADGIYVRRRFTVAPRVQRERSLLNAAVWIVNPDIGDPSHRSGILSGVYLTLISPIGRFLLAEGVRRAVTRTAGRPSIREHLTNIVRDVVPAASFAVVFAWKRFLRPGPKVPGFFVRSATNVYPLHYHGEHLPHWESRVELGSETDALGLPRLRMRMQFSDRDVANVRATLEIIDAHLRGCGVGHLEYPYGDIGQAAWASLPERAGYHQIGTTRMSARPEDGVVTGQLRVHGVRNLWIASTSTFPTSSQANPTLMGVAFAVRLAEHLTRLLRGERNTASRRVHAA